MIEFVPGTPPRGWSTRVWDVVNESGQVIGRVQFWPAWRQYVLFPNPKTLWSHECLQVAVAWLQSQNAAWRLEVQRRKKERLYG